MQQTPAPSAPETAICPKHGLRFNPRLSTGCAKCRRTRDEAPVSPWVVPAAITLSMVGLGGLALFFRDAIQKILEPPATTMPAAPMVEHDRCVGAPMDGLDSAAALALAGDCARACSLGRGASCRRLAGLCSPAARVRVPPLPEEVCQASSADLLAQACQRQDPTGCNLLEDLRRIDVLWKACQGGIGRACADLAPLCSPERGLLADGAPATGWALLGLEASRQACAGGASKLHERGCELGDWSSCELPGVSERIPAARLRGLLEDACDRGDAAGCRRLASLASADEPGLAASLMAYATDLENCQQQGEACPTPKRWRDRLIEERPRAIQQQASNSELGCEQGSFVSCWQAADAYALGEGVRRDEARAASFNERARKLLKTQCTHLDGGACANDAALRQIEACDRGDGAACLAAVQAQGGGPTGELSVLFRRGTRHLRQGCDGRQGEACWRLTGLLRQGQIPGGEEEHAALLRKGCDARHGLSCHEIGARAAEGRGGPMDKPTAERHFRLAAEMLVSACDRGDGASCEAAAGLFRDGKGVVRDEARAAQLQAKKK